MSKIDIWDYVSSSHKCNTQFHPLGAGYPAQEGETENLILCCDDKKYFPLTLEQRYKIETLKNAGLNQTEIAEIVGVNSLLYAVSIKGIFLFEDSELNFMLLRRHRKRQTCGIIVRS